MSLAASGMGAGMAGGGGGMAMSAGIGARTSAMAKHVGQAPPGTSSAGNNNGRGAGAPRSASGLAADMVNKDISNKSIRESKHLPIVCVDLYGEGEISYVPPMLHNDAKDTPVLSIGKLNTSNASESHSCDLLLKRNDDSSYKAVRKLLANGSDMDQGYYNRTLQQSLVSNDDDTTTDRSSNEDKTTVTLSQPHLLLGARRLSEVHPIILSHYPHSKEDASSSSSSSSIITSSSRSSKEVAAIQPNRDFDTISKMGVAIRNQSLDGSSVPNGNDFDRVSFHLDLLPNKKKKPLTMLPEEAVSILLAKARQQVQKDVYMQTRFPSSDKTLKNKDEEEHYLQYPMAIAVPGWHIGDATSEAHLESLLGIGSEGMMYHRCVAATVGSLIAHANQAFNKLLKLLYDVTKENEKKKKTAKLEQQQQQRSSSNNSQPDMDIDMDDEDSQPLLLTLCVTQQNGGSGIEGMAFQATNFQNAKLSMLGKIKVISEYSYAHVDPLSQVEHVLEQLLDEGIPSALPADNRMPCAIIVYGTGASSSTENLKKATLKGLKEIYPSTTIPIVSAKSDVVSSGACVLSAGAHGRILSEEGPRVATVVRNVNSSAVGLRLMYSTDDDDDADKTTKSDDSHVKVIFDFDRRVPAGPYETEFSAAECAAIRASSSSSSSSSTAGVSVVSEDTVNSFAGGKHNTTREEAALAFKVQVVQKYSRDGEWVNVGDVIQPLTHTTHGEEEEEKEGDNNEEGPNCIIAVEEAKFTISIGATGLISTSIISEKVSIVKALSSKRWSTFRYYFFIIGAILFFGGFLVKSYWEERVFNQNVDKLLDYYKHVTPKSHNNGDTQHARYMVYKYRNKPDKLWRNLEVKYGVPFPDEWPEEEEEEEEVVELDDEEKKDEQDL